MPRTVPVVVGGPNGKIDVSYVGLSSGAGKTKRVDGSLPTVVEEWKILL